MDSEQERKSPECAWLTPEQFTQEQRQLLSVKASSEWKATMDLLATTPEDFYCEAIERLFKHVNPREINMAEGSKLIYTATQAVIEDIDGASLVISKSLQEALSETGCRPKIHRVVCEFLAPLVEKYLANYAARATYEDLIQEVDRLYRRIHLAFPIYQRRCAEKCKAFNLVTQFAHSLRELSLSERKQA